MYKFRLLIVVSAKAADSIKHSAGIYHRPSAFIICPQSADRRLKRVPYDAVGRWRWWTAFDDATRRQDVDPADPTCAGARQKGRRL